MYFFNHHATLNANPPKLWNVYWIIKVSPAGPKKLEYCALAEDWPLRGKSSEMGRSGDTARRKLPVFSYISKHSRSQHPSTAASRARNHYGGRYKTLQVLPHKTKKKLTREKRIGKKNKFGAPNKEKWPKKRTSHQKTIWCT